MSSDKSFLKQSFKQLMDEGIHNTPDFEIMWNFEKNRDKKFYFRRLAACFLFLIAAGILWFVKYHPPASSSDDLVSWHELTDGIMNSEQFSNSVVQWESPTRIFLENNNDYLTDK